MLPLPKSQQAPNPSLAQPAASHPSFPHAFRVSPGDADAPTIPVPWEMLPTISPHQPLLEASRALLRFLGSHGSSSYTGNRGIVPST